MRKLSACLLVTLLLALSVRPIGAQEEERDTTTVRQEFGGPNSVPGQLADDERLNESLSGATLGTGWFDWKDRVRDNIGLSFSIDYTTGILAATNVTGGEDTFSGGAVRFFGRWDLFGRESGNTGTFVWKVENRHRYSTIPPNGTASQIGYVGVILPVLSDIGTRLTNLYWKQNLAKGRVEIVAGMLDATDWVDLYALASPWTGFFNFAFATGGASIPVPDDATVGAYLNTLLTENLYLIGGFTDSNANSTEPFKSWDQFFSVREYFKTIELGWATARDRFYLDNTHITFWHADERKEAGVPSGWGTNFSFAHAFDDRWTPFVRAGYANTGGTLLQKTLSTGLGFHFKDDISLLGLGFNWGQPNEDTFTTGLENQFTFELFARLQVLRNLQVTPDIQYVRNPVLNPDADESWVGGVRVRLVF